MQVNYILTKYKGKWSILITPSNTYHFIGCGKKFCENKIKELKDEKHFNICRKVSKV